jgi:hypothetical protein
VDGGVGESERALARQQARWFDAGGTQRSRQSAGTREARISRTGIEQQDARAAADQQRLDAEMEDIGGLSRGGQQCGHLVGGLADAEGLAIVGRVDVAILQRNRIERADAEPEHVGMDGRLHCRGRGWSGRRRRSGLRFRTSDQHRASQQHGHQDGKRSAGHGCLGCAMGKIRS